MLEFGVLYGERPVRILRKCLHVHVGFVLVQFISFTQPQMCTPSKYIVIADFRKCSVHNLYDIFIMYPRNIFRNLRHGQYVRNVNDVTFLFFSL
jgi:hypothetical protein